MAVELLKQVFLANNINEVIITNDPENKASIRVCEKVGAEFIELAELLSYNPQMVKDGDLYNNIWKLTF